jgi:phosphohistidine phosphatase SixA
MSKIPVSQTAEEIFKVVEKFNSKPNKNVKEIHVVIYQQDMMKEFIEAIKKCVSLMSLITHNSTVSAFLILLLLITHNSTVSVFLILLLLITQQ